MQARELKPEELGAILAGLRLLQQELEENDGALPSGIHDIWRGARPAGLDVGSIDELCETLNTERVRIGR